MAADPQHKYSNERERADKGIYDDLKKNAKIMVYTNIFKPFKG